MICNTNLDLQNEIGLTDKNLLRIIMGVVTK
jgi:hypothetical protein